MWKFHDFFITQILREINLGDSTSAKSAISTHSDSLYFAFYEIMHFLRVKITKLTKFRALKKANLAVLELLDSPKLISRKI